MTLIKTRCFLKSTNRIHYFDIVCCLLVSLFPPSHSWWECCTGGIEKLKVTTSRRRSSKDSLRGSQGSGDDVEPQGNNGRIIWEFFIICKIKAMVLPVGGGESRCKCPMDLLMRSAYCSCSSNKKPLLRIIICTFHRETELDALTARVYF